MESSRIVSAVCIVGLQWGDEGKGKIVDRLAATARHVVRFQGGHNAGHTLLCGGKKIALHLLPSGVMRPKVSCHIGGGVVVSPPALLDEIKTVQKNAGSLRGRLFVSDTAALVLPYHVMLDKHRESGVRALGTTLLGIGPAHEDKVARRAVRVYDLYNGEGEDKVADNVAHYSQLLGKRLDAKKIWAVLRQQATKLRPYVCEEMGAVLSAAHARGDNVLLEGAQGVMLDIEQGTYPYTTSAQCLPAAAAGGIGADLSPTVLGIAKAYATRVGHGPFPTELSDSTGKSLARIGGEVGATTGRGRRCGWLDIPMLKRAMLVSGCKRLVLTKLDVLDSWEEIGLCTGYKLNKKTVLLPPADPSALSRCRPVYEYWQGWKKSTVGIKKYNDLPPAARRYVRRIAELTGATIDMISTGPAREEIIVKKQPFGNQTNRRR